MSRANPLWGAPRIHGELRKLGIGVAQRTVAEYMLPGSRRPSSQTWTTFLRKHLGQVVFVDFFTVPTFNFRLLYVFLVLSHQRRQVLHFNVVAERPRLAVRMLVQALKPELAQGTILDGALQVLAVQKWAANVTSNRAPSTAVQGQTPARAFERTLWP